MSTPIATAAETAVILARISEMLSNLSESLARLAICGPLTAEQSVRLQIALFTSTGLEKLFREQSVQYGAPPIATRQPES